MRLDGMLTHSVHVTENTGKPPVCMRKIPSCYCFVINKTCAHEQAANLPHILASICNSIEAASNQVCQAFTWDDEQQRGYFKGGPVNSQYKLDQLQSNFTLCNSPNVTTWILNAGADTVQQSPGP